MTDRSHYDKPCGDTTPHLAHGWSEWFSTTGSVTRWCKGVDSPERKEAP